MGEARHIIRKRLWRQANVQLVPSAILALMGIGISRFDGGMHTQNVGHKVIVLVGVLIFIVFSAAFLRILTATLAKVVALHHLNTGRAASLRLLLRIIGYTAIAVTVLDLVGIPVGKLLLGGAAVGIILGVAAQQALANFFASIVLIVSHPYAVGEWVTLNSGALGGAYEGRIKDIGLTHTKLEKEDGDIVLLPNATLLGGAAVIVDKQAQKQHG